MNAHALLTSQGWRGTGHSLHSTSDSIGLSRPILVAQKQNVLGVGRKQHKTSDLWWMNAFDKTLKGLEVTAAKPKSEGEEAARKHVGDGKGGDGHDHNEEEEEGVQIVQTMTSGGLDMVVKGGRKYVGGKGGLYACFVKGEGLSGTMGMGMGMEVEEAVCVKESKAASELKSGSGLRLKSKSKSKSKSESESESKKRKRDVNAEAEPLEVVKEEKRAGKSAKSAGKAGSESGITAIDTETQKSTKIKGGVADESLPAIEPETETKEQRRERRRLKKLRKLCMKDVEGEEEVESKIRVSSEDSSEDQRRKKKERRAAKKEVDMAESAKKMNAEDSSEKKKRKKRRKEDRD